MTRLASAMLRTRLYRLTRAPKTVRGRPKPLADPSVEIAREIEGLAAGSALANDEPGGSRRERLASLLPKPVRLSPREERAQLRRQFGLEP